VRYARSGGQVLGAAAQLGVVRENGEVFIYYGSSDTRTHVATSTKYKLLDYVMNTPEDGTRSRVCVEQRCRLIGRNLGRR